MKSSRTDKTTKGKQIMTNRSTILIANLVEVAFFALSTGARAVSPAPDGCYPAFTTAEGCNALAFLTTAIGNTVVGCSSLFSVGPNSFNSGVSAGARASKHVASKPA